MLLNVSPLISSGSHLSSNRAYKTQWKSNPILPSNVLSNSKLINCKHRNKETCPQAYLGRIGLQKETTKTAERRTKWAILLRICRQCQWLSKVWFKKLWSITKYSFIQWRLYEIMLWGQVSDLTYFDTKRQLTKSTNWMGVTGGTQRHEISQNIYTTRILGKTFYTIKPRKLRIILLTIK